MLSDIIYIYVNTNEARTRIANFDVEKILRVTATINSVFSVIMLPIDVYYV